LFTDETKKVKNAFFSSEIFFKLEKVTTVEIVD